MTKEPDVWLALLCVKHENMNEEDNEPVIVLRREFHSKAKAKRKCNRWLSELNEDHSSLIVFACTKRQQIEEAD